MKKVGLGLLIIVLVFIGAYLFNNRESNPDFLDDELAEIENYISKRDSKNTAVSQADVAWHLDHMLKTINRISEAVEKSNPEEYVYGFSIQQVVVHTSGMIPRGAAQSPQNVRPPQVIVTDSIYIQLQEAKQNITQLNSFDKNAYFDHPVFNKLDRDQTRRFLAIHTKHHLKIIKDILGE
ncbi:DUF1569 domain-containing protein [Croceitalea rosinachiae]|uniref:DUF1569 domain-containing protein n=1 Tax=Croceitalea rosinachiae TaxID=3075596 RepID=A0ABU3A8S7_9FLAO|nr:DUF1569 domain-containing protein [Croceitalea sp. F388]MDT0606592.1 DUF1569 domain-containing protein [Croceitalea sp. F388]